MWPEFVVRHVLSASRLRDARSWALASRATYDEMCRLPEQEVNALWFPSSFFPLRPLDAPPTAWPATLRQPKNFAAVHDAVRLRRAVFLAVVFRLKDETSLSTYVHCLTLFRRHLDDDTLLRELLGGATGLVALCALHALSRLPRGRSYRKSDVLAALRRLKDAVAELIFYERGLLDPRALFRARDCFHRRVIPLHTVAADVLFPPNADDDPPAIPPSLRLLDEKSRAHHISGLKAPILRLVTRDVRWSQR